MPGFLRCLEFESSQTDPGQAESSKSASTTAPAFNLGVMKEVLGDLEAAESWFRKALELRPGHQQSLEALARIGAR